MILRKLDNSKPSLFNSFQDNFTFVKEKSSKADVYKAFFVLRKHLTLIRSCLFFFSLFSLCVVVYQCPNYNLFLTIPYWSLVLQVVYFGIVFVESLKGRRHTIDEENYDITGKLYEFVFSYQLFNFFYYTLLALRGQMFQGTAGVDKFSILNVSVFSFIAIWIEQLFNMMRFNSRHVWLMIGGGAGHLMINYIVKFLTGSGLYVEMNFLLPGDVLIGILILTIPAIHFLVGNAHYQRKKQTKSVRRKRLSDMLINFKTVKDRSS